jgi:hypothetical protein
LTKIAKIGGKRIFGDIWWFLYTSAYGSCFGYSQKAIASFVVSLLGEK